MRNLVTFLFAAAIVAAVVATAVGLAMLIHGCAPAYPRATHVYGCTERGCQTLVLTEDANGNRVVTPWEGEGR